MAQRMPHTHHVNSSDKYNNNSKHTQKKKKKKKKEKAMIICHDLCRALVCCFFVYVSTAYPNQIESYNLIESIRAKRRLDLLENSRERSSECESKIDNSVNKDETKWIKHAHRFFSCIFSCLVDIRDALVAVLFCDFVVHIVPIKPLFLTKNKTIFVLFVYILIFAIDFVSYTYIFWYFLMCLLLLLRSAIFVIQMIMVWW